MNKIDRIGNATPYEADYALWCAEQGALLRAGRLNALDRENLAEEIESLGRSDKREIRSRLEVLVRHLLKWEYQATKRKSGWLSTIFEQRTQLKLVLEDSPSLQGFPASQLPQMYSIARMKARDETRLAVGTLPSDCPYSIAQILDEEFLPGLPWSPDELAEAE
ncbi:MAG: DUF29 domain-containing protein [Rhizobiaceae bacterium]